MAFIPSPYNLRYFDFITKGRGSAVVIAVAGSGKTTQLVEGWRLIPQTASVQSFAFNTTIAEEMNARLTALRIETGLAFARFRCSTFHSVGFGAILKYLGLRYNQTETSASKVRNILKSRLTKEGDYEAYGDFVAKLVSLAKGEGLGVLVADTDEAWRDLINHHDLYLDVEDATEERAIEIARKTLIVSNAVAKKGTFDFDDQLYLPLLWKLRLWQNDFVFVDEAQDTNPVRRAIAKLALRPGGRFVGVGDPRQGIYGFTGASSDAIELLKKQFNAIELPLTTSYRCCKAVGRLAQEKVPYFEVSETAPEGKVEWLGFEAASGLLGPKDAILCRNTAPLVEAAYKLIAKGIGVTILGKEIGEGLVSLIEKMRAKGVSALVEKLEAFRDKEVAKFTAKGEEGKAESITDRISAILSVIEMLPERERTIPKLIAKIEVMFEAKAGVLTLSTIHKAKGKEWPRVAILYPELMPSKWARQDWQVLQEDNLYYVAVTRAKEHLIFIPKDEIEEEEK